MAANNSTNSTTKLEWSSNPFNISTEWRRIELPFGIISKEPGLYLFIAVFLFRIN